MVELDAEPCCELYELSRQVGRPWREFAEWADVILPARIRKPPLQDPAKQAFVHGFHSRYEFAGWIFPNPLCRTWQEVACYAMQDALAGWIMHRPNTRAHVLTKETFQKRLGSRLGTVLWGVKYAIDRIYPSGIRRGRQVSPAKLRYYAEKCEKMFALRTRFDRAAGAMIKHSRANKRRKPLGWNYHMKKLAWARWILRRPHNHERAFWVQLRDNLRDRVDQLLVARRAIRRGRPLTSSEYNGLCRYLARGKLRPVTRLDDDGIIIQHTMQANFDHVHIDEVRQRVYVLLVPIAYQLTSLLIASQPWPRHLAMCHNPFCGKRFYAGRAAAVTCPSRQHGRRSQCKAAWESFQKWLKKIGRDPSVDWQDAALQEEFMAQYKPRGPQSGDLGGTLRA